MSCQSGCRLFGAYRVAISIKDSAVLIHSTVGCNWGTLLFHTSSQLTDIRQACTVIYEEDLVFGGEKLFKKAMDNALQSYSSRILFVLTGCVPEIMNDDIERVIKFSKTAKPVYQLNSAGFRGDSCSGTADALDLLIGQMTPKAVAPGSVNLIGLFSDDYMADADLRNIKALLKDTATVNAVIPYDTYGAIMNAPSAALNVVFKGFEKAAEKLYKKFGTPYVTVSYPYGMLGSRKFVDAIAANLHKPPTRQNDSDEDFSYEQLKKIKGHIEKLRGMPVAIAGDSARTSGLVDLLQNELGLCVEVAIDTSNVPNKIFDDQIRQSNATLLFGSSFEKRLANSLDIPFMHFTYPVFDKICVSKRGYAGFDGMICFAEDFLNTVLDFSPANRTLIK
jgi:nitrogenase molybdenum-iron protein beta chain